MPLIIIALLNIKLILSDIIYPAKVPIYNSIANRNEFSDYKFTMIPSTDVPAGGFVEIIFPSQYLAGLGIDQITQSTCLPNCEIDKYTVRFFLLQPIVNKLGTNTRNFYLFLNRIFCPT